MRASLLQDDNKSDDEEEKNDDEKISFYLKLGKNQKIIYVNSYFSILVKWIMSIEIESIILYADIVLKTQLKILINLRKWLQKGNFIFTVQFDI